MSSPKVVLFVALGLIAAVFLVAWWRAHRARPAGASPGGFPTRWELFVGVVTNFFDTLGIGSFAPTTSAWKLRHTMSDERIPGSLNVGHTLPVMTQAFIFIAVVEVGSATLVSMIAAAVAGAWLGAGIVAGMPRRRIQIGMGIALLAAATFFAMTNLQLFPGGGDATSLAGVRLGVGVAVSFVLGSLMTLGIGMYAPCMILVALLGMNPRVAFPIMMGSCAFLMPVAGMRFLQRGSYDPRASLGLTLGGVPAVLAAAFIVKSLPLVTLRWGVVAVVLYTAVLMLRSAVRERRAGV
ncbi:MAG TPA: sulfite exporter TauE/SafE family protein [Longimicrobiales bacterium]|nr:sulfite exporter TauE/SafE family protein [Longimicrobiales bacterium]